MSTFKISDRELLMKTKSIAKLEQQTTLDLLTHLQEVDRRSAYVQTGHSSLFSYMVDELGYAQSEAALRVNAMRLLKKLPEVKEKLETGALTLSSAASINSFLNSEVVKKTPEEVKAIVLECEGKSVRAVTEILEQKKGEAKPEFTLKLKGEVAMKFQRLKKLFPKMNDITIIESVIEEKLTRTKLGEQKLDDHSHARVKEAKANTGARNIPIASLRALHLRAKNRCEHINRATGQRCDSQTRLEVDHVKPWAWGGGHEIENLRLLCRSHNLAYAKKCFGVGKIVRTLEVKRKLSFKPNVLIKNT